MGVVAQGAPVFTIGGDPGGIATRAAVMMDRANEFAEIHSSLSSLKADGWTGRAANRFREKYKLQLKGWLDAQEAFSSASTAYSTYASTLQSAQSQCDEIRSRWEQGRRAVEQAQNNKADARSRAQAEGGIPMIDASCDEGPGRATMQGAEEDFQALVNEVNEAGNQLNSVLDTGISKLPERTWLNAISRTAGSFGLGVKDAVTDLFNLLFLGTPTLLNDFRRLITGGLTPEEFFLSYGEVPAEKLGAFCTALANNPKKFFKEVFFGLIDAETWSDDPGRALGRLAPDVALTIATAGAAASAKGLKGAARAAYIGREVVLSVTHISDVSDLVRASRRLAGKLARIGSDAASGLANLGSHLPHSGTTPHTHVPTAPTNPTGHGGTPTMPSAGTPSYPSHGGPTMPSAGTPSYPSHGAPSYGTGGTPSASTSPSYGSGSTPNTSGMSAPSHGNGGYSGNPSHGGAGAVDPNSRFAPPGQQSNGMSGAAHSGDAGTTDPTSKYAPPTHQQNGTSGATQPGTTPQASGAGTSGAATPAAGSHGTSGTASTGAGTAAPAAGAHGNPSGPAHNGMAGEGVSAADGLPPRRSIDPDEPRNSSSNDFHSSAERGESYDAGNRKDSNHLNVDSRDFDKSSNSQYSPANNSGTPQRGGSGGNSAPTGDGFAPQPAAAGSGKPPQQPNWSSEILKEHFSEKFDNVHSGDPGANDLLRHRRDEATFAGPSGRDHANGDLRGTDELVGAGVGRSEASVGPQGSYERAGAFGGSDPSRVSHGADSFGGTANFGANAGHGTHGANGVTNSADTSGGLGSTPSSSHSTGSFTGHGSGNTGTGFGTHGGSSTPAQGSYPAAGNPHVPSHADSGSGVGHSGSHQSGQGANGHSGASSSHDSPTTGGGAPKSEPPIPAPPKNEDPIPAPPKSEAPSTHSMSDTAQAPHAGVDNAAGMPHADHGFGSAHKADAPSTAMDEADLPTREIDGNAVRRRAGAAAGNSGDFSWENNIVNKSGKADDAGLPQHASDPTVGADAPHAPHAGADGATDTSHTGHGDGANHTTDGNTHAADPNTPTHEADGSADVSTGNKDKYGSAESDGAAHPTTSEDDLKNKSLYDILKGMESSHTHHSTPDAPHAPHSGADGAADMSHAGHGDGASHTADGTPHAADPTTPTHTTDGSADVSTGNKYKDKYSSAESDGAAHPTTSEDDPKKNPFYDVLSGNESSHAHHSTPDAPHATHAGADGATDMSHAGHGDGPSPTADDKPHAADPTTPTHTTDGSADVSTGNKYKDKYGSSESDGSGHTTDPEGIHNKNPHHDPHDGYKSSHANDSTADASNGHDSVDELTDPHNKSNHKGDDTPHGDNSSTTPGKDPSAEEPLESSKQNSSPGNEAADNASVNETIADEATDTAHTDGETSTKNRNWENAPEAPYIYTEKGMDQWATEFTAEWPEVTKKQLLTTNDYTTDNFEHYNGFSRDPSVNVSPEFKEGVSEINDFLRVAPKREGVQYRGTTIPKVVLDEVIETGVFKDPGILSTSVHEHIARSFAKKHIPKDGDVPVILEIHSKNGTDIRRLSQNPHEGEVLFPMMSEFNVDHVTVDPDTGFPRLVLSDPD